MDGSVDEKGRLLREMSNYLNSLVLMDVLMKRSNSRFLGWKSATDRSVDEKERLVVEMSADFAVEDDNTQPLVDTTLLPLLSGSDDKQKIARNIFDRCQELNPDRLSMNLARVVEDCDQDDDIRILAADLVTQHLSKIHRKDGPLICCYSFTFEIITPETRNSVKSILLSCIQQQTTPRCVMLKLCATISSLLPVVYVWEEMNTFICREFVSDFPSEAAVLIFAKTPIFGPEYPFIGFSKSKAMFSKLLAKDSLTTDSKIAVLKGVTHQIRHKIRFFPYEKHIFQDFVTPIMKMTTAVMGEDETNGQEALKLLNKMDPNFLMKEQEPSLVVLGSVLDIAENNSLKEGTRDSAFHLLTKLMESAPASFMAPFDSRFLSLGLKKVDTNSSSSC